MSEHRPYVAWIDPAAATALANLAAGDPDELAWQDEALCAEVDPELFYPVMDGLGSNTARQAKQVCRRCPVRAECLEYALVHNEAFGIWGGLSERSRREISRGRAGHPVAA